MDSRARARRERQGLRDFTQRVKLGSYLHLPLWLLITCWNDIEDSAAVFFWANTALFLATTVVRVAFYQFFFARLLERSFWRCRKVGQILVLIPALQWSALAAAAAHGGPLHPLSLPMLLVVVGLASTGAIGLSIDRLVRMWYPFVALTPTIFATMLEPVPYKFLLGIMSSFMLLYTYSVAKIVYQDYWTAVDANDRLSERASSLESLSITDALTQIPNRLHFDQRLEEAWQVAARHGNPLSVLIIDLDHFKRVNDTYGHPCGDECLKAAAQALSRGVHRSGDLLARWGGEEFIVLLAGAPAPAAGAVAQRLLRNVSSTIVPCAGTPVRLTCSIGVATMYAGADLSRAALIQEADRALYSAKQQGRNRVVVTNAA
jgi:diguanylate cyclase (GGDEF)-like protein